MAMTVIDAMRLYALDCDRWIERGGVNGRTILYTQFSQLSTLLPQFAGDCYTRDSSARTITAKIIYNELKQLELYDDYGKI